MTSNQKKKELETKEVGDKETGEKDLGKEELVVSALKIPPVQTRNQRANNRNKPMARNIDSCRQVVWRDLCRASSAKSGNTPKASRPDLYKGKTQERESDTRS